MTHASANGAARSSTIEIRTLMPGARILKAGGVDLALGFPEEVVKSWMRSGESPDAWLVPDVRSSNGIVQWAFEFPLYFSLFVQGRYARGDKVDVLMHRRDWSDLCEYLRLTLLGLNVDEMRAADVDASTARMLAAQSQHLALKKVDGAVAVIEDFITPHFFDQEGVLELRGLQVRSHGNNIFSFFTSNDRIEEYSLSCEPEAVPPYDQALAPKPAAVSPQPFELITLGGSNGFDVAGPCTSFLAHNNDRFVLFDAGPYVKNLLAHVGVRPEQLDALIISHAHEDHAVGLNALLSLPQRLRLYVSRENAEILRRKLAILNPRVPSPGTLLDDAFDVICVAPGQPVDDDGLTMRFHYTLHPIPCTGVELSARHGAELRRVLIVGDHDSRAGVERAASAGVFDEQRHQQLLELYQWSGDLLLADAGAGQIHGQASDFAASPARQLVCVHTGKLSSTDQARFALAKPGHRYTVIPERREPKQQDPVENVEEAATLTATTARWQP